MGLARNAAAGNDICVTAVRQIRALRRLGIAGAGKGRAASPRKGAEKGRASLDNPEPRTSGSVLEPPPAPAAERREAERREGGHSGSVKREPVEEESEYEYSEGEEEEDRTKDEEIGLTAAPKAAPDRGERSELPRRRDTEHRSRHSSADRSRAERSEREHHRERSHHREREERRRSRSRRRGHGSRRDHGDGERGKRKRRRHRAGTRHKRLWRAEQNPFQRFHHKQPDSFWDRGPTDL